MSGPPAHSWLLPLSIEEADYDEANYSRYRLERQARACACRFQCAHGGWTNHRRYAHSRCAADDRLSARPWRVGSADVAAWAPQDQSCRLAALGAGGQAARRADRPPGEDCRRDDWAGGRGCGPSVETGRAVDA